MRAMILAAGRGQRMRPLTDETPKPLVKVAGEPLIAYALRNLSAAGIKEIVINVSYLADKIIDVLGTGSNFGVSIEYSVENPVLETGGGILKALPLLGEAPFIVISADIWTDFPFAQLPIQLQGVGHVIVVPNPSYHPRGDFALDELGFVQDREPRYTFSNISVLTPQLFADMEPGYFRLGTLLFKAARALLLTGALYTGPWMNLGTLEDIEQLTEQLNTIKSY